MAIIALIVIALAGILMFGGHEDDWQDIDASYRENGLE